VVLAELRKFEDARTAFARAIQADPDYAEAHYNLSFTLSNLGDFDGALRETKRALELDPYYVAQRFTLAIDLEFEDADLSVVPDLGGEHRMSTEVEAFAFDPTLLDSLFTRAHAAGRRRRRRAPWRWRRPTVRACRGLPLQGMVDRAMAETSRAMARGATRRTATCCWARRSAGRGRGAMRSSGSSARGRCGPARRRAAR
jgi:cellulose synthase operon protein C